jgi:hypothetical protein
VYGQIRARALARRGHGKPFGYGGSQSSHTMPHRIAGRRVARGYGHSDDSITASKKGAGPSRSRFKFTDLAAPTPPARSDQKIKKQKPRRS